MYLLNYVNAFTAYTLILVSFAMIGKFGVSAAYGDVYINTGELFFYSGLKFRHRILCNWSGPEFLSMYIILLV